MVSLNTARCALAAASTARPANKVASVARSESVASINFAKKSSRLQAEQQTVLDALLDVSALRGICEVPLDEGLPPIDRNVAAHLEHPVVHGLGEALPFEGKGRVRIAPGALI